MRAIWIALLSVAALVVLGAVASTLAHPDPAAVVARAGRRSGPDGVRGASFGSWSDKPFAVRLACVRDGQHRLAAGFGRRSRAAACHGCARERAPRGPASPTRRGSGG
jgi:hypothetical protein